MATQLKTKESFLQIIDKTVNINYGENIKNYYCVYTKDKASLKNIISNRCRISKYFQNKSISHNLY
jgi:hypothetical protein